MAQGPGGNSINLLKKVNYFTEAIEAKNEAIPDEKMLTLLASVS